MILTEKRKEKLIKLLNNIPEQNWLEIEGFLLEQQPKKMEIDTYLQKMYEDDKFLLIATFEDGTDKQLDFIEFKDKRNGSKSEINVWDNDKWWYGVLDNKPESINLIDNELLPIVQQFLKQILN